MQDFRGADAVQDVDADSLFPAIQYVRGQGLAGGDAEPERRQIRRCAPLQLLQLRRVEGRDAEEDGGLERLDGVVHAPGRRRGVEQHGGRAHPQGEVHRIAEAVGEEQLGRGQHHIVFPPAEDADGVVLAGNRDIPVDVDHALGVAGRARGIEPEAIIHGAGGGGFEFRRRCADPAGQGFAVSIDPQDDGGFVRTVIQGGFHLAGEFRRVDHAGGFGVPDHEGVVLGPQQGVQRHGDHPRLDGAVEQIDELVTVLDHHQHALAGLEAQFQKRVAGAIYVFGQLGKGDVAARPHLAEGDLAAASLGRMAVDHVDRAVEGIGKIECRRRSRAVDGDRMVCHLCPPWFNPLPAGSLARNRGPCNAGRSDGK